MRLQENNDFTTLTWVKPELDETLRQARQALEAFVEEGEDPGQLKACVNYLHQVQGTLRMVELYGAAMVAEEMEQLARALVENRVAERDTGYAALMRGIVQLPDYLERLQSGHRDIPIVLLPLLNELREPRGEKGLSESVLFSPDLSRPLPPTVNSRRSTMPLTCGRTSACCDASARPASSRVRVTGSDFRVTTVTAAGGRSAGAGASPPQAARASVETSRTAGRAARVQRLDMGRARGGGEKNQGRATDRGPERTIE